MKKIKELESSVTETASTIWRVFKYVWPEHRGVIGAFLFLALVLSTLPFISSGAQALLINELLANGMKGVTTTIFWICILMIGSSLVQKLLGSLRTLLNKNLWRDLSKFFELLMLRKRSEIDVATYEDPKFQDLLGKAGEKGVWPICNLVETQFQQVTNVAQMLTAVVVFFVFDWRFLVLAVLATIPDFIVQLKYGKSSWDIWDEDAQTRRKYKSIRNHFVYRHNLIELKVFQNVDKFYNLLTDMYETFDNKQTHLDRKAFHWRVASDLVSAIFQAMILGWTIWLVSNGHLKIGTMTFLLGSLSRFQGSLSGLFHVLAQQFEWSLYTRDMFKVLDTKPAIELPVDGVKIKEDKLPLIEFKNVSFAYPGSEELILRDINLTIKPGERLAIVGLNGAGKTTLIKLLMRFYDPTVGVILINGIDLKCVDHDSWLSNIAVLFQDYAKYDFPIREIIALGRSNGKGFLTRVVRVARSVGAHSFIVNFKDRYNQMVGKEFDGGVELSKGQSQKIAVARSIYRNPQVMILDEPTASIDAMAEANIFENLRARNTCTQVLISHRFSTVRMAETICVLEGGTITELGTHDELMSNNKSYAKLFRLQAKGYE